MGPIILVLNLRVSANISIFRLFTYVIYNVIFNDNQKNCRRVVHLK